MHHDECRVLYEANSFHIKHDHIYYHHECDMVMLSVTSVCVFVMLQTLNCTRSNTN